MTLDKACGVKTAFDVDWDERMGKWADYVGRKDIRLHLPKPIDEIAQCWAIDKNLNNIPLHLWDRAAGFDRGIGYKNDFNIRPCGSFAELLRSKGITNYTASEGVCLLKYVAELDARDYLAGYFVKQPAT